MTSDAKYGGILLILVQQSFTLRGYMQCCPRCGSGLTVRKWWARRMLASCPSCGLAIDTPPL